jgi:hypothetical protein
MALSQSILKFKVTMEMGAESYPIYSFQDTTDYTTNSVTLADVHGAIKLEYYVNGAYVTFYDNLSALLTAPDVDGASAGQSNEDLTRARTNSIPIQLKKINGEVVSGNYRVTYKVTDGVDTVTNVVSVDCTFDRPQGNLSYEVDLTPTAPSIVLTDESNYVVQNITPTGTPVITLYFPADSGAAKVSAYGSTLTVIDFYTGEQIGKLSSAKTWDYTTKILTTESNDFTDGNFTLFISDVVTDRELIPVEANNNIAALFCCLKDFANKMIQAEGTNQYEKYATIAGQVAFFYNSIDAAYQTGNTRNVNTWVEKIRDLVDCNEDCVCDDGAPILITSIVSGVVSNTIMFITSDTTTSYQNDLLVGLTYSATTQRFLVFADGFMVEGSHDSDTGVFTPTYSWASGIQIKIVIL